MRTLLYRFGKVCWFCYRFILLQVALLFLLIGIALWWLSSAPLDVSRFAPSIEEKFAKAGFPINFGKLHVGYYYGLLLQGEDVVLRGEDGNVLMKLDSMALRLSNRGLFTGNVAPKEIQVAGLKALVTLDENGFSLQGNKLGYAGEVRAKREATSFIELLNGLGENTFSKYFHTLKVTDATLVAEDMRRGKTWSLDRAELSFEAVKHEGERLQLSGVIQEGLTGHEIPVLIVATHDDGAQIADVQAQFIDTPLQMLANYVPKPIQKLIDGTGNIILGGALNAKNEVVQPWFALNLNDVSLWAQAAHSKPLNFASLTIKGNYDEKIHVLNLEDITAVDAAGMMLRMHGKVSQLDRQYPYLNVTLNVPAGKLHNISKYLPDKVMLKTVEWLETRVNNADVENFALSLSSSVNNLKHCAKECGLDIGFGFRNAEVQFLDKMSPANVKAGKFELQEDWFKLSAQQAMIKQQTVENLVVRFSGAFTEGKEIELRVIGDVAGAADGLLAELNQQFGTKKMFSGVSGTHKTALTFTTPLGKNRIVSPQERNIGLKSTLTNVEIKQIEGLEGVSLRAAEAIIDVTDQKMQLSSNAFANDIPVKIRWREDMRQFGKKTQLYTEGVLPLNVIQAKAAGYGLELAGEAFTKLSLSKLAPDSYDYDLKTVLDNASLNLDKLNWQKQTNSPLAFEARGQVQLRAGALPLFDTQMLTLIGSGAEIMGSFYYDEQNKDTLAAQFAPFKIGRSDTFFSLKDKNLVVKGSSLDLSKFSFFEDNAGKSSFLKEGIRAFDLDIEKIWMKNGMFSKIEGYGSKVRSHWEDVLLSGFSGEDNRVDIRLTPAPNGGERKLFAYAANAGEVMRTLGVFEKMRGGKLNVDIDLLADKNSSGLIEIEDVRLIDAPVLVRLLSLLSLEQFLTSGKGIQFSDVKLPVKFTPEKVIVNKGFMSGPSVGLRFTGDYMKKTEGLNFAGQLIPAEGINKIISDIPLIGSLLTGSQDGLLVADFDVKGHAYEPDVNVNPLSVVTPGLVKDFLGIFNRENKNKIE